jgi:hypothetical protein
MADHCGAWSEALTAFARSDTQVVSSIPFEAWMFVCVSVFVGSGLETSLSPVQRILPRVYGIKKLKERPRTNERL